MQFERAIQVLCDAAVDFVVIGGVAATFHGSAQVTFDLDVCYSRESGNLRRLSGALAAFHPRPRGFPEGLPFIWDDKTLSHATILTLQTDLGEIDLLAEVAGVGAYREASAHSLTVEAFGCSVRVLDLRALIAAKRAAGREKDIAAVAELEGLLEAGEG